MILFGESSEAYHKNPAIGSGRIRAFLKSPRLFKDLLDGIAQEDLSDALLFGIAFHLYLLEPELFARLTAIKPDGMNFSTKAGMAWRDEAEAAGKIIVPEKDAAHIIRMQTRMPDEVRRIFRSCAREVTVRTKLDGLDVQCRVDLWDRPGSRKYDLKSIPDIDNVERAIWKHMYHVQDRWYARVIKAESGERVRESGLIFAEKKPPYRWRIVDFDPDYQALGDKGVDDALHGIKARLASGCWDDPEDVRLIASPPDWAGVPELTDDEEEEA